MSGRASPLGVVMRRLLARYPRLADLLARMRGITGFVSVLGDDPRVDVFRRSHHIERVVWLAVRQCERMPQIDRDEALLIALSHDVNRLPFAHNLEKRLGFDQAENLESYLEARGVVLPNGTVTAMKKTIAKDLSGPPAAQLAYSADAVCGLVEDPLLAVTTLGVPLSDIPRDVAEALCLPVDDDGFRQRLAALTRLFHFDPASYTGAFDRLVMEQSAAFLARHGVRDGELFVERPEFPEIRTVLKDEFLRRQVFPVNNERVSQGGRLAREVGLPLIDALRSEGRDPIDALLDMTDQEALAAADERGLIERPSDYHPQLPSPPTGLGKG